MKKASPHRFDQNVRRWQSMQRWIGFSEDDVNSTLPSADNISNALGTTRSTTSDLY